MNHRQKLFDQFSPVSSEEWRRKIEEDLKGADYQKKMFWKTDEGYLVNPFYTTGDTDSLHYSDTLPGRYPFLRGKKTGDNSWFIRQDILVNDYQEANRKALDILMRGVDSLGFVITDPGSVSLSNMRALLKGIFIEIVELNFIPEGKAREILDYLAVIIGERDLKPDVPAGAVEADPLGRLMLNGKLCVTPEEGFDYLAALARSALPFKNIRTVSVNASNFSNAGAGVTLSLALALASGNEYMVQLIQRGLKPEEAASAIRFRFSPGSDYFAGIAGLRAARLLWSVIQKGFINEENRISRMEIHSVTGRWNKTIYDPYVNMLRTQTEAMSAIIGGTDSLTVEPYDTVFRQPDDFSERIARNQQLILKEEAYFDKVADPSAGSYYIESLTAAIADRAWQIFLAIEEKGGFLESLVSGYVQEQISDSASRKLKDLSVKKSVLLGTNQYPSGNERFPGTVDKGRAFTPAIMKEEGMIAEPVKQARAAEHFEKIRMAVDNSPMRPSVFLLTVGNPAMRKARAQFSAGIFGCAGYRVIDSPGFETASDGVEKALEEHADIVVVCSSDEEYPNFAPVVFNALKGKAVVVIAGNPACADELRSIGVEHFIYMGLSMTDSLRKFNTMFGIKMQFE